MIYMICQDFTPVARGAGYYAYNLLYDEPMNKKYRPMQFRTTK